MTTEHLNNLADALENIAHMEYPSDHHDRKNLREVARILRAAGAADVGGLMAMSDTSIVLACDYLMTHKESAKQKAVEYCAALESALRVALAPPPGFVMVPVEPTREMLNAAIDVDSFKLGDISPLGFRCSPQQLFERCYAAMIAAAQPGAQEPKP